MKERMKTKLTEDIILRDFNFDQDHDKANTAMAVIFMLPFFVAVFAAILMALREQAPALIIVTLIVAAAIILLYLRKARKKEAPKKKDFLEITEDEVVKMRYTGDDDCILSFLESGEIMIPDYGLGERYRPVAKQVRPGDAFLVVKSQKASKPLLYSRKLWRIEDLPKEEIAREMLEEDELMEAVMQSQRFPNLTVRKTHYADADPKAYLKGLESKPESERSFLVRLAAKHFFFDRVNAIEYVIRYCPEEIEDKVKSELTEKEKDMWSNVARHIIKDARKEKRNEMFREMKEILTGSDTYE